MKLKTTLAWSERSMADFYRLKCQGLTSFNLIKMWQTDVNTVYRIRQRMFHQPGRVFLKLEGNAPVYLLKQEHSRKFRSGYQPTWTLQTCNAGKNSFSLWLYFRFSSRQDQPHIWKNNNNKNNNLKTEKKRDCNYFYFSSLTRTRLIRGEAGRVVALSRCITCRSTIKIFKTASQFSIWINGIFF